MLTIPDDALDALMVYTFEEGDSGRAFVAPRLRPFSVVYDAEDLGSLVVMLNGEVLDASAYTYDSRGPSVVLHEDPPVGSEIILQRVTPVEQKVSFPVPTRYSAKDNNKAFSQVHLILQELWGALGYYSERYEGLKETAEMLGELGGLENLQRAVGFTVFKNLLDYLLVPFLSYLSGTPLEEIPVVYQVVDTHSFSRPYRFYLDNSIFGITPEILEEDEALPVKCLGKGFFGAFVSDSFSGDPGEVPILGTLHYVSSTVLEVRFSGDTLGLSSDIMIFIGVNNE